MLSRELQLLYESRGLRDNDVADFQAVRCHLSLHERSWLPTVVAPEHLWIREDV